MAQSKDVRLVTEAKLDVSNAGLKAGVAADLAPIKNDVADLKTVAGLAPGDVNDATAANLIETPGTETNTALSAAIVDSIEPGGIARGTLDDVIAIDIANPAAIDALPLKRPNERVHRPALDLASTVRRNLMKDTENIGTTAYSPVNLTKSNDTVFIGGVALTRVDATGFYSSLRSLGAGVGQILTAGKTYMLSYYALSNSLQEVFIYPRVIANTGTPGYGRKMLQPGQVTRVYSLMQAADSSHFYPRDDAAKWLDGGTAGDMYWLQYVMGPGASAPGSFYVGGFQIEEYTGADLRDGIALIGDSTMEGASGNHDAANAYEVSGYVEALLGCYVYNRATGGERLDHMDARWATDMSPLAARSKYAIIQGGINDIQQGRTLTQCQASMSSMVAKAEAESMIPVILTCTPTATIAADPAKELIRTQFNSWLKATFANVIDIAAIVADPANPTVLRRTLGTRAAGWYGDGTHYSRAAKRAIAEAIAQWPGWTFPEPTTYQPIYGNNLASPSALLLRDANGNAYSLTVGAGGAVTATAI